MFLLIGSDCRRPSDMEMGLPTRMSGKMSASLKRGRRPLITFISRRKDRCCGSELWITRRTVFVSRCFKTVTSEGVQVFYIGSQRVTRPTRRWSKGRETSEVWNNFLRSIWYTWLCEASKTDVFLPKANVPYPMLRWGNVSLSSLPRDCI